MVLQAVLVFQVYSTEFTLELPDVRVSEKVTLEVAGLVEACITLVTFIGVFPGVNIHVALKVELAGVILVADVTFEGPRPCVGLLVSLPAPFGDERLATNITGKVPERKKCFMA